MKFEMEYLNYGMRLKFYEGNFEVQVPLSEREGKKLINLINKYFEPKEKEKDVLRTCFMGKCIHLDPNDDDPCEDIETQNKQWGICHEFKEKEKEYFKKEINKRYTAGE